MSKLFSIAIDVEESALGTILRILNGTPGVAKFHLDLDALPKKAAARKNGGGVGSGKYERNKDDPSNKDVVILALIDGPKNLEFLREAATKAGRAPSGINTTLNDLRKKGITESAGTGLHKLTDAALAEIKASSPAAAALPAPDGEKQPKRKRSPSGKNGVAIVTARMADFAGPVARKILIEALVENGLSPRTIDGVTAKLKADDLIKSTETGVYEFTAKGKRAHLKGQ